MISIFALWPRFRPWALAFPVRVKILGIALGGMFLLGLAISLQVRATFAQQMSEELTRQAAAIARDVAGRAADSILTDDLFALNELVRNTVDNNEDVRYVFVLGRSGQLLAHSFGERFPSDLLDANSARSDDRFRVELLETDEGIIHDVAAPILEGKAGIARVGLSEKRIDGLAQGATWVLLSVTIAVSLIGVAGAYVLTVVLTRPILQLVEVARAVGRGDFSRRAPVWASDEIGGLSVAFNAMMEALGRSRREIEEFNQELLRRNEQLSTLYDELRRKEELRRQLLDKVMLAQEEERKRVARELHDEVGQNLTALIIGLGSAEGALPAECQPVIDQLANIRNLLTRTLEETRRLMVDLRPSLLDDLGLVPAINWYVETYLGRAGVESSVEVLGPRRRLPSLVETTLFRVFQEAVVNIVKHASAKHAWIRLEFEASSVRAAIEDDGRGFSLHSPKGRKAFGLLGMEERVTLLGGTLGIDTELGRGTRIAVEIRLQDDIGEPLPGARLPARVQLEAAR